MAICRHAAKCLRAVRLRPDAQRLRPMPRMRPADQLRPRSAGPGAHCPLRRAPVESRRGPKERPDGAEGSQVRAFLPDRRGREGVHPMWIITSLILLAGGLLGAANLLIAKRPNARELIDKLVPFAGIIGIIMLLWGLRDLFYVLR